MTDLDQFLSKHVDKSHLNKVLSELTFVLKPSDPDMCTNKFLQLGIAPLFHGIFDREFPLGIIHVAP